MSAEPVHDHLFTRTMHIDGCHWFRDAYACECGATAVREYERDLAFDPFGLEWLAIGENGSESCERCVELSKGAAPTAKLTVYSADGTVEIERS